MSEPAVDDTPRVPIGAASRRTGCNVETIRYYERIGLLTPPPRTQGGHRAYGGEDVKRIAFIVRSRGLGFTLQEIETLLGMIESGAYTCAEVKAITTDHLAAVRGKIDDLRRMEAALQRVAKACDGGDLSDCPIVDALYV